MERKVTIEREIDGVEVIFDCDVVEEPADPSVGINGGYLVVGALVAGAANLDRDEIETLFGARFIHDLDESAAEIMVARFEDDVLDLYGGGDGPED